MSETLEFTTPPQPMATLTPERAARIEAWNRDLSEHTPSEILAWASQTFGDKLTLACSFGGVTGMALLDMAAKAGLEIPVFYIDTDFLFPETYKTRDIAARKYGLTPLGFRPKLTPEEQAAQFGEKLWETQPDLCCAIRKVEPNGRALAGREAWIAGLRRDQSNTRKAVDPVQWDAKFGLYKLAPLWNWTEEEVWDYVGRERVRVNELHMEGYASIGCTYCTRPIAEGEDLRAGRWSGSGKTECGLHR